MGLGLCYLLEVKPKTLLMDKRAYTTFQYGERVPDRVAEMCTNAGGVASSLKHFPTAGHKKTANKFTKGLRHQWQLHITSHSHTKQQLRSETEVSVA